MLKRFLSVVISFIIGTCMPSFAAYEWANDGVNFCTQNGIMQGMGNGDLNLGGQLTKAQMAKMLCVAFNVSDDKYAEMSIKTVLPTHWSYNYVKDFQKYIIKKNNFFPDENVTREEFTASLVQANKLTKNNVRNPEILKDNFSDAASVDSDFEKLIVCAVERGYMMGANGMLRPKDYLTRAEAATLIYRVIAGAKGEITLELGVPKTQTSLIGSPAVSVEQAQAWALSKGAHQRFIDIAPVYWKYGELTGIRPDILYAQAAKETGFGKYTGKVKPEMNNWAGIKRAGHNGDETDDHETFTTPDDGVRAHFNHMSAYVGLAPVGEPHGRYYVVKSIAWAGTVKYAEELGGKWCPDLYYGYSVLKNYVNKMG